MADFIGLPIKQVYVDRFLKAVVAFSKQQNSLFCFFFFTLYCITILFETLLPRCLHAFLIIFKFHKIKIYQCLKIKTKEQENYVRLCHCAVVCSGLKLAVGRLAAVEEKMLEERVERFH
ncbi:hypothetical protein AT237_07885 [Bartonella henselae]|nr:hypothetical protein AT237_07885 [Bartonella henselae]OLL47006.1 hypothetical protein AT247_03860 [Bartonella henselae]OLL51302.1 hypothetical protein AT241_06135 [Bartonella henselae]